MYKHLVSGLIILISSSTVFAQTPDSLQVDIVDLLFGKKKITATNQIRSTKKVHFSVLPAAINVPGGGRAVITAVNAAFYMGDAQKTNLSNIYLIPYTNFSNRYGFYIRPNLWLAKNRFNLLGDYRIAHFPQYAWGLGGDSPEWNQTLIDSDYIRLYQTIFFKLHKYWFAGPGYALDYHYNIEESEISMEQGHLDNYPYPTGNTSSSSGFTFNLTYDSRINALNPPKGAFLLVSWRWNEQALGSTFTNNSIFIDARKYVPMSKSRAHILAFRSYYWSVINGETPYLDLPSTSWAPNTGIASRGFETGRYRSNAMLYSEAEQRYQLTANGLIGFVAFINAGSASEFETQHFTTWHVGGGAGLRVKFNKYSNTNLSIDLAFSQNYWGVWLNIGEMF